MRPRADELAPELEIAVKLDGAGHRLDDLGLANAARAVNLDSAETFR